MMSDNLSCKKKIADVWVHFAVGTKKNRRDCTHCRMDIDGQIDFGQIYLLLRQLSMSEAT